MSKSFNWAIIAPGKIAHSFIKDLGFVPNAKVIAVASRSKERAQAFADEYEIEHALDSYESLLDLPNIDCVYIASPHVFHHDHTMMCLDAGIPVLCEKPFAMNQKEVKAMIAKSVEKQVFLMEAMWTRFFPWVDQVMEDINLGKIGDLISLKADFGFKANYDPESRLFSKALGGGALLDIGIYPVFAALLFLGYPDEIIANSEMAPTGVDQALNIQFQYDDGRKAFLSATLVELTGNECIIEGTKGQIEIDPRFHESKGYTVRENNKSKHFDFSFEGKGYRWEIGHVQKCLEQGWLESPLMTHELSLNLISLLDAIRQQIGLEYSVRQ